MSRNMIETARQLPLHPDATSLSNCIGTGTYELIIPLPFTDSAPPHTQMLVVPNSNTN